MVPTLLEEILKQRHPAYARQEDWLEILIMDDCSRDDTAATVQKILDQLGSPSHIRFERNERNLGLSRTLNLAFALARSPFGLTCHCDVLFGSEDYVASMLDLITHNQRAAAITGQPAVLPGKPLPLAEKVNLIANLMDIFPLNTEGHELVPVGFAEGRCDVFRIEALKEVGFYDVTLRLAGEDQVLAARLRNKGYQVYQAPWLKYFLSVSGEQDTLGKLIHHQRLFGRAHPYILLRSQGTRHGIAGKQAGSNRRARTLLRLSQLAATAIYIGSTVAALVGLPGWAWATPVAALFLLKILIFWPHLRAIPLKAAEFGVFIVIQPLLDISYSVGLFQGMWLLTRGSRSNPIS